MQVVFWIMLALIAGLLALCVVMSDTLEQAKARNKRLKEDAEKLRAMVKQRTIEKGKGL